MSDFAAAEFASAIARLVRTGYIEPDPARAAFAAFDVWIARASRCAETTPADIAAANAFLRRLDLTLRAPDAINIAIAQRLNAALMTFDEKMAAGARALGTEAVA